jgi:hypothetical protein
MISQRSEQTALKDQCVVAIYGSAPAAERAVRELRERGLAAERISLVAASLRHAPPEIKRELAFGDKALKNAAIGAGIGGMLGLVVGATVLAVSGLGIAFAAGPIAAGLIGAIVGAFLGGMRGWGVHPPHIAQYEAEIKAGKLLVIVDGSPLDVAHAQQQLEETEAESIHLHAKTEADSPEVDDRVSA